MVFILSGDFIKKLSFVLPDYKKRAGITSLSAAHQPNTISLYCGARDVKARKKQISFILRLEAALIKDFPREENSCLNRQVFLNHLKEKYRTPNISNFNSQKLLMALQVLVTACLYIKSQTKGSSDLADLFYEYMGTCKDNIIDDKSMACCLLATKSFLKSKSNFEEINKALAHPFSQLDWKNFRDFVSQQLDELFKTNESFSMTSITEPLCSKTMGLGGYAIGWALGPIASESSLTIPIRCALTTGISGIVLMIAPSATIGAMVIVPPLAGRIVDATFSIGFAYILGKSMEIVGKAVGYTLGKSFDLTARLLYKTCSLIANLSFTSNDHNLTGFSLIDGQIFINGRPMEEVEEEACHFAEKFSLNTGENPVTLELRNNELILNINGEKVELTLNQEEEFSMKELQKLLGPEQKIPLLIMDKQRAELSQSLGA